jgi:V-type H+-transporting ATPase subunit C
VARIQAYFPYRRSIASDDEYVLFGVVVFKRVHDEFVQKCRENKLESPAITVVGSCLIALFLPRFIVRDFVYSEEQITKQREELNMADTTEKELWVSYTTELCGRTAAYL